MQSLSVSLLNGLRLPCAIAFEADRLSIAALTTVAPHNGDRHDLSDAGRSVGLTDKKAPAAKRLASRNDDMSG